MIGRITHKLNSARSKLDINQDTFLNVNLSGEMKELPPGEINHVVNAGREFDKERQETTIYRILGTINTIFSNPLMNMDTEGNGVPQEFGSDQVLQENGLGLDMFNEFILKNEPFTQDNFGPPSLTFEEAYKTLLDEKDGWFGFFERDVTKLRPCKYYQIEPTRKRFSLTDIDNENWKLTITYPARKDKTHKTIDGGLLIISSVSVTSGGVPMVALATSLSHGLSNGDRVRLSSMPNSELNGYFTVKRLGLDNGDFKENYFVIDVDPTNVTIGTITGRVKRVVNGQESEYYARIFRKILVSDNDYDLYPLAFSNTIFNDKNAQFIINENVNVGGITDNLGRPLSELYLTLIKTDSNTMFHNIQSGLDLEPITLNLSDDELSNVRRLTYDPNNSSNSIEGNIKLDTNNEFFGDIVEYNRFELTEKILTDIFHRFNTKNRELNYFITPPKGPRREGYIYKPHHLIKIREFSSFIEQGDVNTVDTPNYAEDLGDGRFLWRNLLDIGVFDGGELLDYPFTNGAHYIYQNFCFMTMRQDPFSEYGLYYSGTLFGDDFDPPDPIGEVITDRFGIKLSDDGC
jgi:hypothetical protein